MSRYYIWFQQWAGKFSKGSFYLASDLTGLVMVNVRDTIKMEKFEPMYFPSEETAQKIVDLIDDKRLPPGWTVKVEKEEEDSDYITHLYASELQEIYDTLKDYKEPQK